MPGGVVLVALSSWSIRGLRHQGLEQRGAVGLSGTAAPSSSVPNHGRHMPTQGEDLEPTSGQDGRIGLTGITVRNELFGANLAQNCHHVELAGQQPRAQVGRFWD